MIVVLHRVFGVMLTERVAGGRLFESGRRLLAGDRFDQLLDDVLGLTVYQADGRVGFIGIPPAQLLVSSPARPLLDEWTIAFASAAPVPAAVITSFDLWSGARSESSSKARLLLLVMAIEALVPAAPRSASERGLIDNLLKVLLESPLPELAKVRLRNGLSGLKNESVGFSCQNAVTAQLGQAAGDTFRLCYRLRNVIVHGGQTPDAGTLVQAANQLEPVVRALLLGRLGADQA